MGFWTFLRKYFFNPKWRCINCGKEIFSESYFCDDCKDKLPFVKGSVCAHCGRQLKVFEEYCSTCKNSIVFLDKCVSVFNYEKPIDFLIKQAKYKGKRFILDAFSEYIFTAYLKNYFNADYITFVPMTDKAKKKRGYNQSEYLAKNLSNNVNVPLFYGVNKIKETEHQARLKREERIKNLKGSFKITDKKLIKDKSVVVVDDVTTTGTTAELIAEKLKTAGAKFVYLITVASVPPKEGY